MSVWLIIVIIVVALLVLFALGLIIGRGKVAEKRRERELAQRREQAVAEHRDAAGARVARAEEAERQARIAGAVADRERAEARLHEERARAHEAGLADDDLMREDGAGPPVREDGAVAPVREDGAFAPVREDRAGAPVEAD